MGTIEPRSRIALEVSSFPEGDNEFSIPNLLTTSAELEIGTEFIIENSFVDPNDGARKLFERRRYRVEKLLLQSGSTGKRLYELSDLVRDNTSLTDHTGQDS